VSVPLAAIVTAVIGGISALTANLAALAMVGKINKKLPESEHMSGISWDSTVRRKFKNLYPGDRLVWWYDQFVPVAFLCFLVLLRVWVFRR
jgi:hypothetical protein